MIPLGFCQKINQTRGSRSQNNQEGLMGASATFTRMPY